VILTVISIAVHIWIWSKLLHRISFCLDGERSALRSWRWTPTVWWYTRTVDAHREWRCSIVVCDGFVDCASRCVCSVQREGVLSYAVRLRLETVAVSRCFCLRLEWVEMTPTVTTKSYELWYRSNFVLEFHPFFGCHSHNIWFFANPLSISNSLQSTYFYPIWQDPECLNDATTFWIFSPSIFVIAFPFVLCGSLSKRAPTPFLSWFSVSFRFHIWYFLICGADKATMPGASRSPLPLFVVHCRFGALLFSVRGSFDSRRCGLTISLLSLLSLSPLSSRRFAFSALFFGVGSGHFSRC